MQLIFDNMAELREMIAAMGYVPNTQLGELTVRLDGNAFARQVETAMTDALLSTETVPHTDAGFTGPVGDALRELPQRIMENAAGQPEKTDSTEPTKRKRRTKAEIEADKAAQMGTARTTAYPDVPEVDHPKANPLDNLKSEVDVSKTKLQMVGDAKTQFAEMIDLFDGNDRLAHLNEGRAFIEKHGFPVYNETLQLADVPANIAAHTPEQVSRHRAAMAWLAAQKEG